MKSSLRIRLWQFGAFRRDAGKRGAGRSPAQFFMTQRGQFRMAFDARACNREAWRMAMARSPWLNCGATITLSKHQLLHSLPLSGTVVQTKSRQCPTIIIEPF